MQLKLNTGEPGLYALFKPHKAELLRRLHAVTDGSGQGAKGSRELWMWLNDNAERLGIKKMSRSSVIFALQDLVIKGLLNWKDTTGKGGHQRRYYVTMDPFATELKIRKLITEKLDRIFALQWWVAQGDQEDRGRIHPHPQGRRRGQKLRGQYCRGRVLYRYPQL